jgi:hypothetical protein
LPSHSHASISEKISEFGSTVLMRKSCPPPAFARNGSLTCVAEKDASSSAGFFHAETTQPERLVLDYGD